jgi:calcium-dependent protein kinase
MPGTGNLAYNMSAWLARTVGAPAQVFDVYDIDENCLLGVGSFGKVLKGTDKVSGRPCAIKQIAKASENQTVECRYQNGTVKQEVQIMQRLDHPHIVRLLGSYEDCMNFYIVTEMCLGGKLVNFLSFKQDYRESDAALLMQQALSAIKYMHDNHIVHRDIKPENMLLESWSPLDNNALKIIDFGLSCRCSPGSELRQCVGTPEMISPQAIDSTYGTQTDVWSCGVSLYYLLCGFVPFRAESKEAVFAAVRRGNFSFSSSEWRMVSDGAKDLIRSMLKMKPSDRCTAEEALKHPWVRQRAPGANGVLQRAVSNFSAQSAQRKCPQQEANVLVDIRSVLGDVTQWANSILPHNKMWDSNDKIQKPAKAVYWI